MKWTNLYRPPSEHHPTYLYNINTPYKFHNNNTLFAIAKTLTKSKTHHLYLCTRHQEQKHMSQINHYQCLHSCFQSNMICFHLWCKISYAHVSELITKHHHNILMNPNSNPQRNSCPGKLHTYIIIKHAWRYSAWDL